MTLLTSCTDITHNYCLPKGLAIDCASLAQIRTLKPVKMREFVSLMCYKHMYVGPNQKIFEYMQDLHGLSRSQIVLSKDLVRVLADSQNRATKVYCVNDLGELGHNKRIQATTICGIISYITPTHASIIFLHIILYASPTKYKVPSRS